MTLLLRTVAIGVIATGMMDIWGVVREPLFGFRRADYRLIGRWFAYMPRGRFRHASIAASPSLRGEHVIGWSAHYLIGVAFATLLVWFGGPDWLARPTLGLALLVGLLTLLAPLLLMQPGMGAGIAASRTPDPTAARLQSLITHLIYGAGLYVAGWITLLFLPN